MEASRNVLIRVISNNNKSFPFSLWTSPRSSVSRMDAECLSARIIFAAGESVRPFVRESGGRHFRRSQGLSGPESSGGRKEGGRRRGWTTRTHAPSILSYSNTPTTTMTTPVAALFMAICFISERAPDRHAVADRPPSAEFHAPFKHLRAPARHQVK